MGSFSLTEKTAVNSFKSLNRDDTVHGEIYYLASEVDAFLNGLPTRESVADDIGVLVVNGDLPANMEDLADWVQSDRDFGSSLEPTNRK